MRSSSGASFMMASISSFLGFLTSPSMALSVLVYSLFTAACGAAPTASMLALFRIGVGLGMGGEWASGAALVSEVWPDRHRAKALALMQSSWAVGWAATGTRAAC